LRPEFQTREDEEEEGAKEKRVVKMIGSKKIGSAGGVHGVSDPWEGKSSRVAPSSPTATLFWKVEDRCTGVEVSRGQGDDRGLR